jgi:hypothetical protein
LIIDKNGKFEWWNRGFADLFAYKIEKYKHLPLKQSHFNVRPDIYKEIKGYTIDKGTISYTNHEVFDNGEEIWYQTTIIPVEVEGMDMYKFVVMDYNITTLKNNEKEIQKLQELIGQNKYRLTKAVAELKVRTEDFRHLTKIDKTNLEYSKLLRGFFVNNDFYINFSGQHFIVDLPQYELSGDFFGSLKINEFELVFFVGDSTGHKVRGTINSVITINLIREIYNRYHNFNNNEILSELNKRLKTVFESFEYTKDNDFINLALVKYNKETQIVHYSGSKIPLYHLIKSEDSYNFIKYEADRINLSESTLKAFTSYEFKVSDKDRLYIATDGWINQFGKFGHKKYNPLRIKEFLLSIQNNYFHKHQELIINEITEWRGSFEQTDDIFIFGAEF